MISTALSLLDLPADRCMMVGDRLETDITMGLAAGMATCLVLTGDATREKLAASGLKPTLVLDQIGGLLPPLSRISASRQPILQ
jgi:ribonucleotide monophosphatase NagD (HAD superfamily)